VGRAGVARPDLVTSAFEAHHAGLYAFARRATQDADAADDAVAEAFARLVSEQRRGRWPDNVGGWLFRVTANVIVSSARRRSVLERVRARLRPMDDGLTAGPAEGLVRREGRAEIEAALAGLPPDARTALLLAARGFSGAEIATAIGRSELATRSLMCRARLRLRAELESREEER
jgi:RNA polymerase sigma-70 factor (ECF subfamily)